MSVSCWDKIAKTKINFCFKLILMKVFVFDLFLNLTFFCLRFIYLNIIVSNVKSPLDFLNFSPSADANNKTSNHQMTNLDLVKDYEDSPDDSPQNEQPYVALENCNNQTLRRFGTLSSLEKLTNEDFADVLKNSSESEGEEEEEENASNETDPEQAPFASSLRNWTAKAGSFVSEKMSFFERFNDDGREGFFDRLVAV